MEPDEVSLDVTLREITDTNRAAVCALQVNPDQLQFVGSVAGALEDAAATPEARPWYRAIDVGGKPVGFVLKLSVGAAPAG